MDAVKLEELDRQLIRALQKNARLTQEELGRLVHRSTSVVSRRLAYLDKAGFLTGAHAVVDPKKVGLGNTFYIMVRLEKHRIEHIDSFADYLNGWENVVEWSRIIGSWDYMLKVVVRDLDDYASFYQKIQAVEQVLQLRGMPVIGAPVVSPIPI